MENTKEPERNELDQDELEEVAGGKIHFEPQKDKPGWSYDKHSNDDRPMIRTGEYLWIKK